LKDHKIITIGTIQGAANAMVDSMTLKECGTFNCRCDGKVLPLSHTTAFGDF